MAPQRDSSPNIRDNAYTPLKDGNDNTITPNKPRIKSAVRTSTNRKLTARTARSRRQSPKADATMQPAKNPLNLYSVSASLNDPTSVTMQSSFLIKNHQSANFEAYHAMMKKRKNM